MANAWDLIKAGKFDQACAAADQEHDQAGSILPLRNKVLALLNLAEYEQAATLSNFVVQGNGGDTDRDYIFLGVAHWLQGQADEAINAWRQATRTDYTDAAGGVEAHLLLSYAGVRNVLPALRRESILALEVLSRAPVAKNWPGPIASHVSGRINEADLRESISLQPVLHAKQTCQAAFHAGVMNLLHHDDFAFQERMREAAAQGPFSLTKQEYYLALREVGNK